MPPRPRHDYPAARRRGLPTRPEQTPQGVPRRPSNQQGCTASSPHPPGSSWRALRRRTRRFLAYSSPSHSPDPRHLAVLTRPGFVGAAPTLPGTSRLRLPPASTALLRQDSGGGLSPPLEQQAPHGAHSGKHKRHGLNVQVLTDPAGRLIWASPALPGSIHDLKAARRHGLIHALTGYDIPTLADRGYQGAAGTIRVPIRGRNLPDGPAAVNTAHAQLRAPGERGPATLKTWRLLRRLRCCPQRGTNIIAAVLTLETATRH
jgi:hypothetical protein